MKPPLMRYAEHVDAEYKGRLTMRRGYALTEIGEHVRDELDRRARLTATPAAGGLGYMQGRGAS